MDGAATFPLGSVLFPYTPLVLRVFEPRYLTMMGRLLDTEDPEFGVVLIERGLEAGGGEPGGVGTKSTAAYAPLLAMSRGIRQASPSRRPFRAT